MPHARLWLLPQAYRLFEMLVKYVFVIAVGCAFFLASSRELRLQEDKDDDRVLTTLVDSAFFATVSAAPKGCPNSCPCPPSDGQCRAGVERPLQARP